MDDDGVCFRPVPYVHREPLAAYPFVNSFNSHQGTKMGPVLVLNSATAAANNSMAVMNQSPVQEEETVNIDLMLEWLHQPSTTDLSDAAPSAAPAPATYVSDDHAQDGKVHEMVDDLVYSDFMGWDLGGGVLVATPAVSASSTASSSSSSSIFSAMDETLDDSATFPPPQPQGELVDTMPVAPACPSALPGFTAELCRVLEHVSQLLPPPTTFGTWSAYLAHMQLTGEPDDALLARWAHGDFPTLSMGLGAATYLHVALPANDRDVLPDNWYVMWHDMTPLTRLYSLWCVQVKVEQELAGPLEPLLEAWSMQFLIVILLRGDEGLRTLARRLLVRMGDLARWHSRYVFSGGFLRHELFTLLSDAPHLASAEAVEYITRLMHSSDGVAFFEQVENWDTQHALLSACVPALQRYTRADFARHELAIKSRVFEHLVGVIDDEVVLKYRGCPMVVRKKMAELKHPRLLAALQQWRMLHDCPVNTY